MITDANGTPLAAILTGANRHDVTQLLPLVDAVPPVRGQRGRPRRRPERLYADRAYDSREHRESPRSRTSHRRSPNGALGMAVGWACTGALRADRRDA